MAPGHRLSEFNVQMFFHAFRKALKQFHGRIVLPLSDSTDVALPQSCLFLGPFLFIVLISSTSCFLLFHPYDSNKPENGEQAEQHQCSDQ